MSEYKIHVPSEEGYPDVKGRFYECTCGANYIDIEQVDEWQYCPYCGEQIIGKETLACSDCEYTEYEDGSLYCGNPNGKYDGEYVTDMNFDGCNEWRSRDD
jgi:DNA-directed RNA polymerase subunit RPC12/RpoP